MRVHNYKPSLSNDIKMFLNFNGLLLKKTSQFKTVCKDDSGCITQLKLQKSKKVILLSSTLPDSQCADK